MRLIHEPSGHDLKFWAVLALAAAGAVLWWGLEVAHAAPVPHRQAHHVATERALFGVQSVKSVRQGLAWHMTVKDIAEVISCQVRAQRPHVVQRRMAKYYNPTQVMVYAAAVRSGLQSQEWPQGLHWRDYIAIMLATVYQQSRWKHDAVSEWNTDGRGMRIKVSPAKAWKRPKYALDYGLGQPHWGWAWKRVDCVEDLKDPATNLRVMGWWFARRAVKCADHYEKKWCRRGYYVRGDRDCGRKRRCLATRKEFGVPGYAGTTDNLVRTFAPPMWRCVERVMVVRGNKRACVDNNVGWCDENVTDRTETIHEREGRGS